MNGQCFTSIGGVILWIPVGERFAVPKPYGDLLKEVGAIEDYSSE